MQLYRVVPQTKRGTNLKLFNIQNAHILSDALIAIVSNFNTSFPHLLLYLFIEVLSIYYTIIL